ncbi:MAG: glycosyltransferase [Coxiellaceae bacterium]|nr:glycosyltransferase [Coxiellaceae bacterium]
MRISEGMPMHKLPLVSIIMNCFNGEKYLQEAIDSVYAQTYTNWEIIFFDNASTDSSAEIAKSYGSKLKYYKNNITVPLYAARNLAVDYCNGELVAFLDCDDVWLCAKLEAQVELYRQGYKLIYNDFSLINECGNELKKTPQKNISGWITRELFKRNVISISSAMISARELKRHKFDPIYDLLGDYDLWMRLSLCMPVGSINEILQYSRQHGDNLTYKLKKKWLKERRHFVRKFMRLCPINAYAALLCYSLKAEIKGLLGKV